MHYLDLPEYAALTPVGTAPAFPASPQPFASLSPLDRLVASIHRRTAAPSGYRFVANIPVAELDRAVSAVKLSSTVGEVRLITPAVDDGGNQVPDIALYVRNELPEPAAFWLMFHLLGQRDAA